MEIKYKNGTFYISPGKEKWWNSIKEFLDDCILSNLNNINSIDLYELCDDPDNYYLNTEAKLNIIDTEDDSEHKIFLSKYEEIHDEIEKYFGPIERFLEILNGEPVQELAELLSFQKEYKHRNYDEESLNIEDYRRYISIVKKYQKLFKETFKYDKFFLGGAMIECKNMKEDWMNKLNDIKELIFKLIIDNNNYLSRKMDTEKDTIVKILDYKKNDELISVEKYDEINIYCQDINNKLRGIWGKLKCQEQNAELLEENFYEMKKEDTNKMWSCYGIPRIIHVRNSETTAELEKDKKRLKKDLKADYFTHLEKISALKNDFETNLLLDNIEQYDNNYSIFSDLKYKIELMMKSCNQLNDYQIIVGLQITDFSEIRDIYNNFLNYFSLWDSVYKFESSKISWMNDQLKKLDRKVLKNTYDEVVNTLDHLEKNVFRRDKPQAFSVIQQTRLKIKEFQPFLPVLFDIINPDLKPAQISELSKVLAMDIVIPDDLNINFKELVNHGILDHLEQINERSTYATGQKNIASKLEKFKEKYKILKLDTCFYKTSDLVVLKDTEPVIEDIDFLLTKVVSISTSKFAKFLQKDIEYIRTNLAKSQELIDLWVKVQKYMQQQSQIFIYDDIKKQLAVEYTKYENIERIWKSNMESTKNSPQLTEVCQINKIKENLIFSLETLENVNKSLNSYLNTKRDAFARFYFISNEELLIMLAQSGDPVLICNSYVQQSFEGIKKLIVNDLTEEQIDKLKQYEIEKNKHSDDEDLPKPVSLSFSRTILSMCSEQGEIVPLKNTITPYDEFNWDGSKHVKAHLIEKWMNTFEDEMKLTVRLEMMKAYKDLKSEEISREDWACKWIEQAVLSMSQLDWTTEAEQKVENLHNYSKALTDFIQDERENLDKLILKIRNPAIPSINKKTLVSLIIQDVHANDVVEYLIENKIDDLTAFEWVSQLRYYTEKKRGDPETYINVKMLNTERFYDYEYLGNQKRLVVTTLTDRCYRTMMEALNNSLGGAPEGPAGTGKTETIKDLSKNLGKKCFTYNCSEDSDIYLMSKFFKGIAMTGAWICFDEFNRTSVDILSVIAFQISQLLMALRDKSHTMVLDTCSLPFNQGMGIFITMNPDYAGRSQLPDNCKQLFRPLAMMVPEYAMIAKIMLYSYGFNNAGILAKKICLSLNLASEQLSSQLHYDYGMRALNGIITYSGILIRDREALENEKEEEENKENTENESLEDKFIESPVRKLSQVIETHKSSLSNAILESRKTTMIVESHHSKITEESKITEDEKVEKVELTEEEKTMLKLKKEREIEEYIVEKSIRDSNMPKFIADDYKIYEGILSDLFPGKPFVNKSDLNLTKALNNQMGIQKLIQSEYLLAKIIDLHNIISVRHGVMIVGDAMTAKSSIIKLYIKAMEEVYNNSDDENLRAKKVRFDTINPKAITSQQLFGYVNKTKEFVEGVMSIILRDYFSSNSPDTKFLVMDGPVDTKWIENMNSVLDDTKRLCLENSDQIRLDSNTFIIFEVDDLSQASLATISRCGMVFSDRNNFDVNEFYYSWIKTFPDSYYKNNFFDLLTSLYKSFFIPIIKDYLFDEYNNFNFKSQLPVFKNWMCKTFINVLEGLIFYQQSKEDTIESEKEKEKISQDKNSIHRNNETKKDSDTKKTLSKLERTTLLNKFVFSIFISLSWVLDNQNDQNLFINNFNEICKNLLTLSSFQLREELLAMTKYFVGKNLLDMTFSLEDNHWENTDTLREKSRDLISDQIKESKNNTILIPTSITIKANTLVKASFRSQMPICLFGPTGTGKTLLIKDYLNNESNYLQEGGWINYSIILNARTTANNTCDSIEEKISFKLKKNTIAPPNNKNCLLVVEDLNMPIKEKSGAQPAVETIRQFFDYGGWYDRKEKEMLYLNRVLFFACLTTNKSLVSSRLLWHFIPCPVNQMNDNTLKNVYFQYLDSKLSNFSQSVKKLNDNVCDIVINTFNNIIKIFKALPKTPHYSFNIRDINKIFQGLTMVPEEYLKEVMEQGDYFYSLLIHETYRVYCDRLVDNTDRGKFKSTIVADMFKIMRKEPYDTESIMFSEVNYNNVYCRVNAVETIKNQITEYIEEYNVQRKAKDKLDLILFDYSLKHLLRIDRILSRNSEHAVLIGLTGSGRQSLANIASFIKKFKIFKIKGRDEVEEYGRKEWLEDIKEVFNKAGIRKEFTVFLLRDSTIKEESFYVDLNCMISSGIVYNLFTIDEKNEIISQIKSTKETDDGNNTDDQFIWDSFISNAMQKLRVFLCLNPLDTEFTKRLRTFPALINNTTIDWYESWPESALYYLAEREFSKNEIITETKEGISEALSQIFSKSYLLLAKVNEDYYSKTRRKVIILPKSFLDYVIFFQDYYSQYKTDLAKKINKYKNGVIKIDGAEEEIKKMTILLEKKKPILVEKSKLLEVKLKEIDIQKTEANDFRKICEENSEQAKLAEQEAEHKKELAENNLKEAEIIKADINKKIQNINPGDLRTIGGYSKPPPEVTKMMQALYIIKSNFDKHEAKNIPPEWSFYKKMINDTKVKFMPLLESLPKKINDKQLSEKVLTMIAPYNEDKDLEPDHMKKKTSSACGDFCSYFRNMTVLDSLLKNKIIPSNEQATLAKESLKNAQANLEVVMNQLADVEHKLDNLQKTFDDNMMEKNNLEYEILESQKKLVRAQRLTSKLSGEKVRWGEIGDELEKGKVFLFGDIVVSSFYVSFMGPYLSEYRDNIIKQNLFPLLQQKDILFSNSTSISKIIGNPFKIQEWIINGLPSDSGSVDNGIILFESTKPAILIDPQKQAVKFLAKMFKQDFLAYRRSEEDNLNNQFIENSIKSGKKLVFDNIGYDVFPEIEPLLNQEIVINQNNKYLKLNENQEVLLNPNFKFYLLSYLPNPEFNSELYTKVNLINFTVTKPGLTEQLLSIIVREESPSDEAEKNNLLQKTSQLNETINKFEQEILNTLNNSPAESLLDSDSLVIKLEESKKYSDEAQVQIKISKSNEERIDHVRFSYQPLAQLGTLIFFSIQELAYLEDIYKFSIMWFINSIVIHAIKLHPPTTTGKVSSYEREERVKMISDLTIKTAYIAVSRSLFNKDKLLFAFMILLRRFEKTQQIEDEEEKYLFKYQISKKIEDSEINEYSKRKPSWIDSNKWENIIKLNTLKNFEGILEDMCKEETEDDIQNELYSTKKETLDQDDSNIMDNSRVNTNNNTNMFENSRVINNNTTTFDRKPSYANAQQTISQENLEESIRDSKMLKPKRYNGTWEKWSVNPVLDLPSVYYNSLNLVKKLLILKIFNLENFKMYISDCISEYLSPDLAQIPLFTLEEMFEMSTHITPLMIIFTTGIDPLNDIKKMSMDINKELYILSLGQGQTAKVKNAIDTCQRKGHWVFLQNCHLVPDFMKHLEIIINKLQSNEIPVNQGFRLAMSALSSPVLYTSVLMNSLKITLESPNDIKSNLKKIMNKEKKLWEYDADHMKRQNKEYEFSRFLFSLMHFHSMILNRKTYGSLGWNIQYNFNESDFLISRNIIKTSLERNHNIPYKAMIYLTSDCIYGGRVTDNHDRRTLFSMLTDFYNEKTMNEVTHKINGIPEFEIIHYETVDEYSEKIENLPDREIPELIGLHPNALIRKQITESLQIINSFSSLDNENVEGGQDTKTLILQNILETANKKLIRGFNIEKIKKTYPIIYEDCMNSILIQEVMRYNSLLELVLSDLEETVKAFQGVLTLTDEMEHLASELVNNKTPATWINASYPSKKPIGSWLLDLCERIKFFDCWIDNGVPTKFWFSAFFFTQSFLTAIKQNYARKNKISIDNLDFKFVFVDIEESYDKGEIERREKYYTYGLFIEGAQWNNETHCLDELEGKSISANMPPIILYIQDSSRNISKLVKKTSKLEFKAKGFSSYECPVYKCSSRKGNLSTTGISTNYIFSIELPSKKDENHWIRRGVALLNQLDD